jgi:DNA-binding NtrC family response regulator
LPDARPAVNGDPPTLADVERRQILEALDRNGGNRTRAARELGISRRKLHYRLSDYERGRDEAFRPGNSDQG